MTRSLALRRAEILERLGGVRFCECCGYDDVLALEAGSPVLCAACSAILAGRSAVERHHVAGRRNGTLTIDIGVNSHRLLSERQRLWPRATLENRSGSAALSAAGHLRGFADLLVLAAPELPARWTVHACSFADLLFLGASMFESYANGAEQSQLESKVPLISAFASSDMKGQEL